MPKRVQRQRSRGWVAPLDDQGRTPVYVGRGSKWGNPFKVGGFYLNRSPWHDWPFPEDGPERTRQAEDAWLHKPYLEVVAKVIDRAHAVDLFRRHIAGENVEWSPDLIRSELAGRDLMCWCPLADAGGNPVPCHADSLLAIANGGEGRD